MANDPNSSKTPEDKENSSNDEQISEESKSHDSEVEPGESESDPAASPEEAGPVDDQSDGDIEDAVLIVEDEDAKGDEDAPDDAASKDESAVETTNIVGPVDPAPARGSSAFALVFGGLIAGAVGFLVATFAVPEGWPNPPADENNELQATISAQSERIDALTAQVESFEIQPPAAEVDLTPVMDELASLTATVEALSADVSEAGSRIATLEERPVVTAEPAPEVDFNAEMDAFRSELEAATAAAQAEVEAAEARASQVEAEAARAAEVSMRRAALAEISAALESGAPYADALANLPDAPEQLAASAQQGIPTLTVLRAEFPEAARAALRNAQSEPSDGSAANRLTTFLRQQTNARSLSPRDGDDADAVLSRAEAALNAGDLETALAEVTSLTGGALESMSDWIALAETRIAAVSSVQSLANDLN